MGRRFAYLDILRVISVMLVMYGHFVLVAGGAKVIPGIINPGFALPLVDETQWKAYVVEVFLIEHFSTQAAILGVSLFFLITGMLMPMMCERYDRPRFIINRAFRIFPTLAVALICIGVFLYFSQGITFSLFQYFASLTLSYPFLGAVPVIGVLWTLVIEFIFYLITFLIGRYTPLRLVVLQSLMLLIIVFGAMYKDNYMLWLVAWNARFILLITIGSAIYLADKESGWVNKVQTILPSIIFSYVGFQLFKFGRVDPSTYETIGTHLLAVSIFLLFHHFGAFIKKLPSVISATADIVYPVYLGHPSLGLATMALMKQYYQEPYFLLASAIIVSLVVAWLLHIIVEKPSIMLGRRYATARQAVP